MTLNYDPRPPERRLEVERPPTPSGLQPWRPWVALGGAAAVVVGSLLPWVTAQTVFGNISFNGMDGDGKVTFATGALFAVLYHFGKERMHAVFATFVALATLGVALNSLGNVQDAADEATAVSEGMVTAQVGIGLWMVLVGAIVMLVGIFGRTAQLEDKQREIASRQGSPPPPLSPPAPSGR